MSIANWFLKTAEVPATQQRTQWTCSAACLRAVLQHHGEDWPESILVPLIGAKPKRGAECDEIAEAARLAGFSAFEYSFASVEQARVLLDQDIPIICDIQSFNHPGKGHYVVLTHIDDEGAHLMDPNAPDLGNQRRLSLEEMEERWWDHGMKPPHELMERWGIIIVPTEQQKLASPQFIREPIKKGLRKLRFHRLVGKVTEKLTEDVPGTPRLLMKHRDLPERAALGSRAGDAAVDFVAEHPEAVPMLASPIPGTVPAYLAAKRGVHAGIGRVRKAMGKESGIGGDASSYLPRGPSPSDLAQWRASQRLG